MAINMRNYQLSNGKRTVYCGLCRNPGHNRSNCPMVEPWAEEYVAHIAEHETEWGLESAWKKRTAYNIRERKLARASTPRTKPACGFCRSTTHNRRNCTEMERWRKKLLKANIRWRKSYAKMAQERGITPGSVVEVTRVEYNWHTMKYEQEKKVLLIDNTLPENLTVFCAAEHWEIRQGHNIPLVGDSKNQNGTPVSWLLIGPDCPFQEVLTRLFNNVRYSQWGTVDGDVTPMIKVLKQSDYQFTDEWIHQTPADIDYVLKKLTEEKLKQFRLDALIDKWG